jgi:DivIVA domain-containing protein
VALTAQDVHDKQFKLVRQATGYDIDEVDSFLDVVEAEIRRLSEALAAAQSAAPEGAEAQLATSAASRSAEPTPSGESEAQQVTGILALAQRMADEYVEEARRAADTLVRDAQERARTVLSDLESRQGQLEARVAALRTFEAETTTRLTEYLQSQLADLRATFTPSADPSAPTDDA